ncbi:hypothetical protein [Schnuerera ultunensis]|uniref:Uncharacterized protein n=1 Tax=[Clostridium] ultunense Esp TaxID=1288971 RepID=A0A1M4PT77_9FIRM|nr:hypothetical protein [Schnuerera ultunensis]SHD78681.1 conserved protein of unknown function [[Clostridium] ultunense Esp]
MDKTDPLDAYIITYSARRGRAYVVSNIYLKFNKLAVLDKDKELFYNYGATPAAVLTELLSLDDVTYSSIKEQVNSQKKVKFALLVHNQQLNYTERCKGFYKLDKVLYEPLNVALAPSFNLINTLKMELSSVKKY